MKLNDIPMETIDWETIPVEPHPVETGCAYWKTKQYGDIRIRVVEYSPNYRADHWCKKGHIVYCLEGAMTTELKDGRIIELRKGMSYHVEDGSTPHRTHTKHGAILFIVD